MLILSKINKLIKGGNHVFPLKNPHREVLITSMMFLQKFADVIDYIHNKMRRYNNPIWTRLKIVEIAT